MATTTTLPQAPQETLPPAPPPSAEVLVADVDEAIRDAKTARRLLDQSYAASRRAWDVHIERLEAAKKALRRTRPAPPSPPPGLPRQREVTAAGQAGKANIRRVRAAAKKLGTATQAQLGAEADVGTGNLTWAIKALEEEGCLRATGQRVSGSREFEYVPQTGGATRRRLAPGEEG